VAFQAYTGSPDPRSEALTVALDGSGPSRLVDSQRVWSFCQSADGTQTAHRAEGEVPGEPFVWVAGADGSDPVIVSETANLFWCGFPPDAMLLGTGQDASSPQAVVRHDLSTGAESIVAEGVIVLGLSPDGSRLAVVDEGDRSRLDVVDVATGDRWTVAGPEEGTIRAAWWSPDGASVAYLIGETTGFDPAAEEDLALSVIDVAGGRPTELIAFHGREPEVSWSADSARLLLRGPTSHSDAFVLETPEGPLWLLERAGAEARMVLEDGVRWAGWSPVDPDTFAYATGEALFLSIPDGQATRLVDRPTEPLCELCWDEGPWQVGHWLGWSPDGRYVGLGRYSGAIAVVDTTTGELLVPLVSEEGRWIDEPRWWR
jgi:dipeptidyl aminopeptidase/acylaminoacyl peptidase